MKVVMKYTISSATSKIERNGGKVFVHDKKNCVSAKNVGIGTWGAVDFLVKQHGYLFVKA